MLPALVWRRHGPSPTFRASYLRDMATILLQLPRLPQLQALALPAALLCSCCCDEGHGAAAAHADLLRAVEALAGAINSRALLKAALDTDQERDGGAAHRNGGICSCTGLLPGLRHLAFLDVQWPEFSSCYSEDCWHQPVQHRQRIQKLFDALAAKWCKQSQTVHSVIHSLQQQQQSCTSMQEHDPQVHLQLHLGLVCRGGLCLDNPAGHGVWGVYGPPDWCAVNWDGMPCQ